MIPLEPTDKIGFRFQWDPKCDSLREQKILAFFENLERHNESVEEIEMSMFHGEIKRAEDPEHDLKTNYFMEEVAQFGDNILRCLRKKNLKRFIVNFQVICPVDKSTVKPFATVVVDKIIQVFEVSPNFPFQTATFFLSEISFGDEGLNYVYPYYVDYEKFD